MTRPEPVLVAPGSRAAWSTTTWRVFFSAAATTAARTSWNCLIFGPKVSTGVGRWVIAFAKMRGLKTVNIVRRPELGPELEAIGGDLVVVDSPDVSGRIKTAVGQAELRLALDGVSGPATGVLAATLSPRGTLVSFAAMSSKPMSISPLDVIFKPVTVRGFFMAHAEFAAKLAPAAAQAAEMIASGRMHIPVAATYSLSSIKEAVAHAQRGGKILLDVAGSST